MSQYENDSMEINWDQQKVISNPLRSRMIALLYEEAMTPKQTANLLGMNPGTVYYHIQQLFKHGIIEVESVNTERGVVEKYYRAKATSFKNPEEDSPNNHVKGGSTHIYLSDKLLDQFNEEIENLFYKYGHLSYKEQATQNQDPYVVEYLIKKFEGEENE